MGIMKPYYEICTNNDDLPLIKLPSNNQFELPRGAYAFVELYCNDPDCGCKRGMIDIYKVNMNADLDDGRIIIKNKPLATMTVSWEKEAIDREIGIYKSRQSYDRTQKLLNLLEVIVNDEFAEKLKRHYSLFKQTIRENKKKAEKREELLRYRTTNSKKTGRNDLCPCGSGKKYKKCCIIR